MFYKDIINTYKAIAAADVLREIHPEIVCISYYKY